VGRQTGQTVRDLGGNRRWGFFVGMADWNELCPAAREALSEGLGSVYNITAERYIVRVS
jgi:hypothetical protein